MEDMIGTDEEQWDERLSQQDVQQVTGLPAWIAAAACPSATHLHVPGQGYMLHTCLL